MILTGPTRAPSGLLCLPDQWPLSWAHPSVTRSSSCSQPLEQPRPVTTTNWLSTAAWRPFFAIVCGQMSFPLHTAPGGPARAACCFWERGSLSFSRKPSLTSFSNWYNLGRLGQETPPDSAVLPRPFLSGLLDATSAVSFPSLKCWRSHLLTEAELRSTKGGRAGLLGRAGKLGARDPRSRHDQAQSQDNYMPSFADCIKIIRMRDLKNIH